MNDLLCYHLLVPRSHFVRLVDQAPTSYLPTTREERLNCSRCKKAKQPVSRHARPVSTVIRNLPPTPLNASFLQLRNGPPLAPLEAATS